MHKIRTAGSSSAAHRYVDKGHVAITVGHSNRT